MKMNTRTLAQVLSALILSASLMGVLPHAFAQSDTATVVIVGPIEATSDVSLTVNGLTVDISQAQIDANLTLALDEIVQIEGALQTDGSILADSVSVPLSDLLPGEVEVIGLLTSLDTTTAVVDGIVFDITAATVDAAALPGAMVRVFATPDLTTNIWVARELSPVGAQDASAEMGAGSPGMGEGFRIVGTLDAIGDAYIVVSGLTLETTNAEFDGMPLVGALVSVKVRVVDGALVAVKVEANGDAAEHLGEMEREGEQYQEQAQSQEQEHAGQMQGQGQATSEQCRFEVKVSSANLRGGPGTGYDAIGFALGGEEYAVTAVDASGGWAQVQTPMGTAWVALSVGELGDCGALPISDAPYMGESHDNHDNNGHQGDDHGEGYMGESDHGPSFDDSPMGDDYDNPMDDFMPGGDDHHDD